MSNTVPFPVSRVEPTAETKAPVRPEAEAKAKAQTPAPQERPPSTRLMIEDVGGRFVYTVLDRVTGQVLAQIPRDELQKLGDLDDYAAGAVIDTQA
jgi:flagellar protein FlaG